MSMNWRRRLQIGFAGEAVSSDEATGNSIGADFISIIAVLLSFIICALLLDFIVRCVVRCFYDGSVPTSFGEAAEATDEIRKIPIVIHGSDCSICLNQIEAGQRVRHLPICGHSFHVECVDRWLAVRSSCPTCRRAPFVAGLESSECAEPEKAAWKALNREFGL